MKKRKRKVKINTKTKIRMAWISGFALLAIVFAVGAVQYSQLFNNV